MVDCHFERMVCDMFRPKITPFVLLFKKDKVYEYNNMKSAGNITKQELLDFLSSDLYKTEGLVYHTDTNLLL